MFLRKFRIQVEPGHTEHISFKGHKIRRPTVLIRVGKWSFSEKAFLLGVALVACQVLDGILTYAGVRFAVAMEGNVFIRQLMHMYGLAPALLVVKCLAVTLVVMLAGYSHRRRWIRPLIIFLIVIYFTLAVLPWTYLLSASHARSQHQEISG